MSLKLYILLGLLGSILTSWGQQSFVVKGRIKGIEDGAIVNVTQWYGVSGITVGEDTIKDGRFMICGEVDNYPGPLVLDVQGNKSFLGSCMLWVGPETTQIKGSGYDVNLWKVRNRSKEQKEENYLMKKALKQIGKFEVYYNKNQEAYTAELADRYFRKKRKIDDYPVSRIIDSLLEQRNLRILHLLESREKISIVGMKKLIEIIDQSHLSKVSDLQHDLMKMLYLRLDSIQKNSVEGIQIKNFIFPGQIAEVGDNMIDGLLWDLEGKAHYLSDYRGKYILLDFWGAHCGACVQALPELDRVRESYKDSLYVIGISLETSREIWQKSTGHLPGIQLSDLKGMGGLISHYGFVGMPQFILIDPYGKILTKWTGYGEGIIDMQLKKYWNKQR